MTSAKEGAVFESILPQQKKGDDDNTRLEFGEGTSANESAVLETISPQQKKDDDCKTRLEFGEGTCNDKRKGGRSFRDHFTPAEKRRRRYYTLRIRRSHERQGGCSFRDPFSPTQKNEDDANLR